jgi:hypothetical protein
MPGDTQRIEESMQITANQYDPVDLNYLDMMGRLGAGKRVLAMVDAHEFIFLDADPTLSVDLDEGHIFSQAQTLGEDVLELWVGLRTAAQDAIQRAGARPPSVPLR